MKTFSFFLFLCVVSVAGNAQLVYKDVAGIFYKRCTSCHHENQHAPSMMNYAETSSLASAIQADLISGKMPPWSPDTTYTRFVHERIISSSEKNAILSWINSGSQLGDVTQIPPAPTYSQYQLNGKPDLILKIPTFTSNAGATDAYNCFAVPTGLTTDRIVRAYELVPGNAAIVHHIVIKVDTAGKTTSDLSGICFIQKGDFDLEAWAPGAAPTVFPGEGPLKCGMRLQKGSKLILQIHYPAGTAGQKDSTQIRLYFYPTSATGIRPIYVATPLQNWDMEIGPNTTPTLTAQYPLSGGLLTPLSIYSAFPHSHLLCTSMLNYADSGTTTIPLIRINKWDFNWQGFYTFPKLVKIPAGYTLRSSHTFDNTANNPNNPNNPPQEVKSGPKTGDEMLFDSFKFLSYQAGDELIDIGSILANDTLLHTAVHDISVPQQISSYAFPNPFNDYVRIGYELTSPALVSVSVSNIYGSKIKDLAAQFNSAGAYSVVWDGNNDAGTRVSPGIYFYTIHAGSSEASGKIVRLPADK